MQLLYILLVAWFGLVAVRGDSSTSTSTSTSTSSAADGSAPSSTLTATSSTSTGNTCPGGGVAVCGASVTICKNTASPANSGTCTTYSATNTVLTTAALTFTYDALQVAANAPCPGTCVISVTQNTFLDGVLQPGMAAPDQTITYTGTTSQALTFTSTGGDGNAYTIPVTAAVTCTNGD